MFFAQLDAHKARLDALRPLPAALVRNLHDNLVLNLELLKAGFPAIVMPVAQRLRYYETLDRAHLHGDLQPFIVLVCELLEERFAEYWQALGG